MYLLSGFFTTVADPKMKHFSVMHILPIVLTIIIIILVYKYREELRNYKNERYIRYGLVAVLIISELSIQIWRLVTDTVDIGSTLPLHLCSISAISLSVSLLTKNQKLFNYVFYIASSSAIAALVYPDVLFVFPTFRYLEFFILHGALLIGVFYLVYVQKLVPEKNSLFKAAILLHIIAVPMGFFNHFVGARYWMLVNTELQLLKDLFGEWPRYIIGLELLVAVLFVLTFCMKYFFVQRLEDRI